MGNTMCVADVQKNIEALEEYEKPNLMLDFTAAKPISTD